MRSSGCLRNCRPGQPRAFPPSMRPWPSSSSATIPITGSPTTVPSITPHPRLSTSRRLVDWLAFTSIWTPSLKKMFLVFTSTGEGSCFDSSSSSCAYTSYCAYHGYFGSTSAPTIYANQPYADPAYCYYSAGGQTDPSGDIPSDANVNVASHEITEANTDPELDAWWDTSNGEEIGDLCAWTFGTNTWDSAKANQMWNGRFYELQLEYDNHVGGCVQVGP